MEKAIEVKNLCKNYRVYDSKSSRIRNIINTFAKKEVKEFKALTDVSFHVNKGEIVGIIGNNGAGKSTLLKILTGVSFPSSGEVNVNGRVSSLLELGTGFNPELTGEVLKVIKSLTDLNITMVIVTHEMAFAKEISDRIIFMDKGVIIEDASPDEVFSSDNERTREFLGKYHDVN